mmetsp:Transcript_1167/g.4932  ORF Transcript_1167/g.4932 Transcript_1167/m.4932 type:complete len:411 (-) Transcript_1167:1913-3145(-)|eukprot:scaffold987_cov197-Pinguiococcus_pyrenoidosus.AAC.4
MSGERSSGYRGTGRCGEPEDELTLVQHATSCSCLLCSLQIEGLCVGLGTIIGLLFFALLVKDGVSESTDSIRMPYCDPFNLEPLGATVLNVTYAYELPFWFTEGSPYDAQDTADWSPDAYISTSYQPYLVLEAFAAAHAATQPWRALEGDFQCVDQCKHLWYSVFISALGLDQQAAECFATSTQAAKDYMKWIGFSSDEVQEYVEVFVDQKLHRYYIPDKEPEAQDGLYAMIPFAREVGMDFGELNDMGALYDSYDSTIPGHAAHWGVYMNSTKVLTPSGPVYLSPLSARPKAGKDCMPEAGKTSFVDGVFSVTYDCVTHREFQGTPGSLYFYRVAANHIPVAVAYAFGADAGWWASSTRLEIKKGSSCHRFEDISNDPGVISLVYEGLGQCNHQVLLQGFLTVELLPTS